MKNRFKIIVLVTVIAGGICFARSSQPVTAPAPAISGLHGGIGMGTWDTKAEFRDILVQTGSRTLLQPNFPDSLNGWQKGGGEWAVTGSVLTQNSRAINCQIICGDNTWTDYIYSLKAKRTEGTEGFLIIFAAQDAKNLYWWNIGGWGNTRTAIEKMTRGGKREITDTAVDLSIETGTWYDILIAVSGDTAACYFNGNLITKITQDKGSSSLPDAGPPTIVNNGNGPVPVTSAGGIGGSPRSSVTRSGAPVPIPEIPAVSPTPRLNDPASWVPKANGCLIEQTGNRIHIVGTNNIDGWGNGNSITTTRFLPAGSFYAAVDFAVPQFSGSGSAFVYLRAKSTTGNGKMLAILFQPKGGSYQVQGWGADGAANTYSQTSLQKIGDEDKAFHRMKLKYDAAARLASGWIDDKFIGMLDYTLTEPVKFELLANTESKGMQIDLYFDNLYFTSNISEAPPTPARPASEMSTRRSSGARSIPAISGGPAPTPEEVIDKALIAGISELRGGIGMGTWGTKAEFKDILVQTNDLPRRATQEFLNADNSVAGTAGKTLLRPYFTNGLEGWQIAGGQWAGASGVLTQNSRNTNCQIICGDNTWTNYTYSLKARRIEGNEGFLIIFAAQDGRNLYWWNIGGWNNMRTAIEKMTRSSKREIPGTAVNLKIETGIWYDIKIALHGDTADCYFNSSLITSITQDRGTSTMPDAGPPQFGSNGSGTGTGGRGGSMQVTNITPAIPETSPAPKMDDPGSWVPIANGCQIQQTDRKISITGINNIDGWGNGNGVISTTVIPAGDFYATVNFIVRSFSGPGNARVYFRAVSTKGNGKMAAVVYDPQADTFQIQGWGVNGEPNTVTQPVQKAGSNMMYRWLTLQYDSKNKTIFSIAASNRYLGTIDYDLPDPVRFELLADADTKGMQIDIEFNNFSFKTDRLPATPDRLTGSPIEQSATRRWLSPNGKHAIQIVENLVNAGHGDGARGPIIFRRTITYVTGMAVDPNGTTSKLWEWTEPQPPRGTNLSYSSYITLQISDVLAGDSGNRFVLLGRFNNINSVSSRAFQRVIVILDEKGNTHAEVTADAWSKTLGQDGIFEPDNPPKLRFLDNDKVLEIKLSSGKSAIVNTDSGELSVD